MHNFNLDPPPNRTPQAGAKPVPPMQGVDSVEVPKGGPQGGRWVGMNAG